MILEEQSTGVRLLAVDGEPTWRLVDLAHESMENLPDSRGLLRSNGQSGALIFTVSVRKWVERNRQELQMLTGDGGSTLLWLAVADKELEAVYRSSRGTLRALTGTDPTPADSLAAVPEDWGLYFIHQATGSSYVGITSNLRRRLHAHGSQKRLVLERGDRIEYLLAARPRTGGIITWADLQEAEKYHIRRLAENGVSLVNRVAGGNGQPPANRFNVGPDAHSSWGALLPQRGDLRLDWTKMTVFWGDPASPQETREADVLDLRLTWSSPTGEWLLNLAVDQGKTLLWAFADRGDVYLQSDQGSMSRELLSRLTSARYDAEALSEALTQVQVTEDIPPELEVVYWWPTAGRRNDDGVRTTPAQVLHDVTAADVLSRRLPENLTLRGFSLDETFRKEGNINAVIRVKNPEGATMYLKVEQSRSAARAEVLASLLWYKLGWPGIADRVLFTRDESVLIIPPVGGVRGIVDLGDFDEAFRSHPFENRDSLRTWRASVVKRLGLADLRLADPDDVLRFVTTNAAWGNTDRHVANINYGWQADEDSPDGGWGYLLPIDHGRCFFGNDPGGTGAKIAGSPAAAVTGRLSNPHQLLRAFVEQVDRDPDAAADVVLNWCTRLLTVLESLIADPQWSEYKPELSAMAKRTEQIQGDPHLLFNACRKVVVP